MATFKYAQLDGFETQIVPQWDGLHFPDGFFFPSSFPDWKKKKKRERKPPVPLLSLSLKADGQINKTSGW